MANKKLSQLGSINDLPVNAFIHITDPTDDTQSLSGSDYKINANKFLSQTFRGAINLATPTPILDGTYRPTQSGTYSNFGGLVVDLTLGTTEILVKDGVYTKIVTPIVGLGGYVPKTDIIDTLVSTDATKPLSAKQGKALKDALDIEVAKPKGVTVWTATAFASGVTVSHLGKYWKSNASTVAGDIPGTSAKWVEELTGYINDASFNLIPNTITGLDNIIKGAYNTAGTINNNTYYSMIGASNGASIGTFLKNHEGFRTAIKTTVINGEIFRYFSQRSTLSNSIVSNATKVVAGVFVKVGSEFSGTVSVDIVNNVNWGSFAGAITEFEQLSNDWRYYRTTSPIAIGGTTTFGLMLKIENTGLTPIDFYFSAPAVVKSSTKLMPRIYTGNDSYESEIINEAELLDFNTINNNNIVEDALFDRMKFPSNAGSYDGWSLLSNNFATVKVSKVTNPVGQNAIDIGVLKRSSDSALAAIQFRNISKLLPNMVNKGNNVSIGFWMKRDVNVNVEVRTTNWGYSGNYLGQKSSLTTKFKNETIGNWVFVSVENITLFTNSYYLGIDIYVSAASTSTLDQIYKFYATGFVANMLSPTISSFAPNTIERITEVSGRVSGISKNWTSYGDSITWLESWQKHVVRRMGYKHTNLGIGGSYVRNFAQTCYVTLGGVFISFTLPAGVEGVDWLMIEGSMSNQQRINTIPLTTEIITIMGGTNDLGNSLTQLGTIDDTGVTTFYGAYQTMLERIKVRLPKVEIVLATIFYFNSEPTILPNGYNADTIRKAVREIGYKYGYKVVEVKNIGVNKNNYVSLTTDGIHPNPEGGERLSRAFCEVMSQIY